MEARRRKSWGENIPSSQKDPVHNTAILPAPPSPTPTVKDNRIQALNGIDSTSGGLPSLFHRLHFITQRQISSDPVWDHSPLTTNNKLEKSIPTWTLFSPMSVLLLQLKKILLSAESPWQSATAMSGHPTRVVAWGVSVWQSKLTLRAVVRVGFSLNMSRREMERVSQLEMAGEGPWNQSEVTWADQITSLTFFSCSEDHFKLVSAEPWWVLPFVFYIRAVLFPKTLIKGHYIIMELALVAWFPVEPVVFRRLPNSLLSCLVFPSVHFFLTYKGKDFRF